MLFAQWVPHPFAFFAKGWAAQTTIDYKIPSSTARILSLTARVRGSHPCTKRKGGAPAFWACPEKTKGGPPDHRRLVLRPEDWKWSSFLQWATGREGRVEVECPATAQRRERMGVRLTFAKAPPHKTREGWGNHRKGLDPIRMGQPPSAAICRVFHSPFPFPLD